MIEKSGHISPSKIAMLLPVLNFRFNYLSFNFQIVIGTPHRSEYILEHVI